MLSPEYSRSLYQGHRPNRVAKFLGKLWSWVASSGIAPNYLVTLEVTGRKSGKTISLPVVLARVNEQRYIVSMLGNNAQWVLNVQAANGKAAIRAGRRIPVLLEDVPVEQRAPILKNYVQRAPGGRPHIPVDRHAPVAEFERIAADYPIFRIVSG